MGFLSMSCPITRDSPAPTPRSHPPKGGKESGPARSLERVNEREVHYPFVRAAHRRRNDAAAAAGGRGGGRRAAPRGRPDPRCALSERMVVRWSPRLLKHVKVSQTRVSVRDDAPLQRRYVHSLR